MNFGNDFSCATCSLDSHACPGHFGHIEMPVPVYNPITYKLLYKLLQSTCYYCHNLRTSKNLMYFFEAKLRQICRRNTIRYSNTQHDFVSHGVRFLAASE